jgi:hypothetical protein
MTTDSTIPSTTEKEALEIAKLRVETDKLTVETQKLRRDRFLAPLTLAAQILGSFCIIGTGIIALYYFQRPQLDQMEATRISNERLQLENYVLSIQKFENDNDKLRAFEVLAAQWPQYPFLADIARSAKTIVETKRLADDCKTSAAQVADLNASIQALETRITQGPNVKILGGDVRAINDPSIRIQQAALRAKIAAIQQKQLQDNCPL